MPELQDKCFEFPGDHGLAHLLSEVLADDTDNVEYVGAIIKHPLERAIQLRVISHNPVESICNACDTMRTEMDNCYNSFMLDYNLILKDK